MIHYRVEDVEIPLLETNRINRWIRNVAGEEGKKVGQITYIFCSDEKIIEINKQYLGHDYFTDIITFDYSIHPFISGDIFISLDTVRNNAIELDINFKDELMRIIIHGILHLCGQNDKSPEQRAQMTQKENNALEKYD